VKRVERFGAFLALPLALVLIVLAFDVLYVSRGVSADDFRFQASATRERGLWEDLGLVPGSLVVGGLGIEDDLAYRGAASRFARVRPGRVAFPGPQIEALRGQSQLELTRTSQAESDPRRRSQLLNFLGVMPLDRRIQDAGERASVLQTAIGTFQSAVRVDPENADAKLNLEIVLRDATFANIPADDPSGERSGGERSGAGRTGGGY
jgi:hypothetical protein